MNTLKAIVNFSILLFLLYLVSCNNRKTHSNSLKSKLENSITIIYSLEVEQSSNEYKVDVAQLTFLIDVFCNDTVKGKKSKGAPFMSFTFMKQDGSITKLLLIMIDKERFILQGDVNDNYTYYGELRVEEVKDIILKLDMIDNQLMNEISSCSMFKYMPYSLIDFSKWNNKGSYK